MGLIIDMSSVFPWRILTILAHSFAFFNIAHAVLRDKIHPMLTFSSIFAVRLILSVLFSDNENLNFLGTPLFLLIAFILSVFLTEGKPINRILSLIFYCISNICAAFLNSFLLRIITKGIDPYELYNIDFPEKDLFVKFFIDIILNIVLSFLVAGILKIFRLRKSGQKKKSLYAYFSFFPVSHIIIIIFTIVLYPDTTADFDFRIPAELVIYLFVTAILLLDCSFPFVVDRFEKLENEYSENKKELEKSRMNFHQLQLLKNEKENFRKIKHDYMNIITTTKGFIEIGKPDKALDILNNISDDITNIQGYSVCSNESINIILYTKKQHAETENISFNAEVNETAGLKIDDYSLCRILHNIIDNAIEAAGKSTQKFIEINISIDCDEFKLSCKNSFNKDYEKSKNRNNRGYGTKIIKDIIKDYDGTFTGRKDNDYFYSELCIRNKSVNISS